MVRGDISQISPSKSPYLHAPAVNEYAKHDPSGETILPDGRYLKPVGKHLPVGQWPHGLTLSPDGSTAFVASAGVGQLISDWSGNSPQVSILDLDPATGKSRKRVNAGAASFSPDGRTLYWSGGDAGTLYYFDVASRHETAIVSLNSSVGGRKYIDSFAMDIKLSSDGAFLYCADITNFRV